MTMAETLVLSLVVVAWVAFFTDLFSAGGPE